METYTAPQPSFVRVARMNTPPSHLRLASDSNQQSSNHAIVFLGSKNTRNQETQTRPVVPARSPIGQLVSPATSPQFVQNGTSPLRTVGTRSPSPSVPNRTSPWRQTGPISANSVFQQRQQISLAQGRSGPRKQNDYVGGPMCVPSLTHDSSQNNHQNAQRARDEPHLHRHTIHKTVSLPPQSNKMNLPVATSMQAPSATTNTLKTQATNEKNSGAGEVPHGAGDSILCHRCRRCKCSQCAEPRDLPSTWICGRSVHVSADTIVDCCTGVLCVQSAFYHCGRDCVTDADDDTCADEPCACCSRPHVFKRWLCLALMSLCLPCLCMYWPARGCVAVCTAGYNRATRRGCRCRNKEPASRRALLEPDSLSS